MGEQQSTPNPVSALLSTIFAGQDAKWGQSSLINILNTMNAANQTGLGLGLGSFSPANDAAQRNLGQAQNLLGSPTGGLGNTQEQIYGNINGLNQGQFQQQGLQGRNSANLDYVANSAAQQTQAGQNGLNSGSDAYMRLLAGNGQLNPNSQQALDSLTQLANGGGTNQDLKGAGIQAVYNGGLNGYDSRLQSLGDYTLSRGGYDARLNNLADAGARGIANGGNTDTTRALQGIGTNFAGQQALLPTALAASFAKDQAGQQARKGAEAFQAQALARGGGAGATVANGAANQGLADFQNKIDEAQSNAYQNSLVQQQGLNLQQQGQGAQMALGAGNLAAGQLGTYGNLGTQAAAGANASAGTYGNLGVAGGQLGNQTLGIGTSALNNAAGNQVGAASGVNGISNTQLQALLGAGQGLNANAGTANTGYNNALNGQLGSQALGNTQANSLYTQLNNLYGSQNANNQTSLGLNNSSLQALLGLSGQGFNYAQAGLQGQSGLFQNYASTTNNNANAAWQQLGNSTGPQALSGWATALQGASGSGGGGGGGG